MAVVLGSDIIWDYSFAFFDNDPYLFGNGLKAKKKVAYSCISQMRRYRSNLQALFLVHPAAFIQVAVDQKQEYNC